MDWLVRNALLVSLCASSAIAFLWPASLSWNPFAIPPLGIQILVAATMFCLGLVVRWEELTELRRRPASVFLGVLVQSTLMPLLAFLAVLVLGLSGPIAQGVILVGCVPGAMASNVLAFTARGNVSYSISLTTAATLLSPITVPTALWIVGGPLADQGALNPWQRAYLLLITVVLPVVTGFACRCLCSKWNAGIRKVAPVVASVALLWIIASVVAGNRERLASTSMAMIVALLSINVAGYLGGYAAGRLCRLPSAMKRTLAIEVGMQNAGLGTFLAVKIFGPDSPALIPTAAYTFGCMLTGTLLANYWSRQDPDDSDARKPQDDEK